MPSKHRHKGRMVRIPTPLWEAFVEQASEAEGGARGVILELIADYMGWTPEQVAEAMAHDDFAGR